jgi:general secretion pathway protein N
MTLPPVALPAALAAVFALIAAAELLTPLASPGAAPTIRMVAATAAPAADASAGSESWSAAILARPLFRPDRRPLAPDAAVKAPLPRLSAIVITAAGRTAIFSTDDGKSTAVAAGGLIDGYRIQTIGPGEVSLTGPDGSKTLRPQFAPDAPTGAGPGAAPLFIPAHRLLDNE